VHDTCSPSLGVICFFLKKSFKLLQIELAVHFFSSENPLPALLSIEPRLLLTPPPPPSPPAEVGRHSAKEVQSAADTGEEEEARLGW